LPFVPQLQFYDSVNNILPIANNFENNIRQFRQAISFANEFTYKTRILKKPLGIVFKNKVKYLQQNILDKSQQQYLLVSKPWHFFPYLELSFLVAKKINTILYLQRTMGSTERPAYYKGIIMAGFRSLLAGLDTLAATFANTIGSYFFINDNQGYPKWRLSFSHSTSNAANSTIFKTQNNLTYFGYHLQQINTSGNSFTMHKSLRRTKSNYNLQINAGNSKSNFVLNDNSFTSKYYSFNTIFSFDWYINNWMRYNLTADKSWAVSNQISNGTKYKSSYSKVPLLKKLMLL